MSANPPSIPLRLWAVAAVTGSGAFMAMLDSTVANLALDTIGTDLGVPLADVQWVATGYLVALAVSLPWTGWLGRRFGQGRVWTCATLVFVGASVGCAMAGGLGWLIALRGVQGLAAGLMVPASQAVLAAAVGKRQLGRLMGTVGLAVALGPALGPGLGGVLIEAASWRWLFWINVPVGVIALLAARRWVPPGERLPESPLDRTGLVLIGFGLPLFLYGAAEIGTSGLGGWPLGSAVLGAILTAGFLTHAVRSRAPLVDVRLLRLPGFAAAVTVAGLTGAAMYGGLLLLPLHLQHDMGLSPTEAGLLLLVMGLGSAGVLPLAGSWTDRYGAGPVCLAGSVLLLVGTAPFLWWSRLSVAAVVVLLLVRGIGLAAAQMPAMTAAYNAVEKSRTGDAATLVNIAQRLGGALGAVATVVPLEHGAQTGTWAASRWAFMLLSAFAVAAFFAASRLGTAVSGKDRAGGKVLRP